MRRPSRSPIVFFVPLLLAGVPGCPRVEPAGGDTPSDLSCEAVAAHVEKICGAYAGVIWAETIRQIQCAGLGGEALSRSDRRCLLSADTCKDAELACKGAGRQELICRTDAECPGGLSCAGALMDTAVTAFGPVPTEPSQRCVRCASDAECAAGAGCADGLCYPKTALPYTARPEAVTLCTTMCADSDPTDCVRDDAMCVDECTGAFDHGCPTELRALSACIDRLKASLECDPGTDLHACDGESMAVSRCFGF